MVQNLENISQNETENKLEKFGDKNEPKLVSSQSQPQNVDKRRTTFSNGGHTFLQAPFGAENEMLSPTSSTSVLDNNSDEDLFLDERELKFKKQETLSQAQKQKPAAKP